MVYWIEGSDSRFLQQIADKRNAVIPSVKAKHARAFASTSQPARISRTAHSRAFPSGLVSASFPTTARAMGRHLAPLAVECLKKEHTIAKGSHRALTRRIRPLFNCDLWGINFAGVVATPIRRGQDICARRLAESPALLLARLVRLMNVCQDSRE